MSTGAQLAADGWGPKKIHGDVYYSTTGTIVNGSIDTAITLTGLAETTSLEIINDNTSGSGQDLIIKLNATGNPEIIVRAGETKSIDDFRMNALYFTNSCGATITYRVLALGVSNT
jgi:hypothetical protein